jgi:hypothetical protein
LIFPLQQQPIYPVHQDLDVWVHPSNQYRER